MAQNAHHTRFQKVKWGDTIAQIETVISNGIECLRLEDVQRHFHTVRVKAFLIDNVQKAFIHDEAGKNSEPLRIVAHLDKTVQVVGSIEAPDNDIHSGIEEIKDKVTRIDANTQEILRQIDHVMTQMYQLHEFTTPRYFFILPAEHRNIKTINTVQSWFHVHYILYFLCECSQNPKEMHVAPHEGYSIKRPRDFILRYGPYLKTTLTIAQALLSIGGFAIPQLGNVSAAINHVLPSQLKNSQFYTDTKQKLQIVDDLLNTVDNQQYLVGASIINRHQSRGTALQGAELREIQTYLELVDDKRSLGNLYRIVTADGHVRWVCHKHYDAISYNNEMSKYINEFTAMGGTFDETTNEALINQLDITSKNVELMCKALEKGFNIMKLTLTGCLIYEGDLKTLLGIIINRSSICCLNMVGVRVRNSFRVKKYTCQEMIAEFNNQTMKVRFSQANRGGNMMTLVLLLLQNKIRRNLDFSASDFLDHESDLQRSLKANTVIKDISVEYCNNIDIMNSILSLEKNELHRLKLSHSLCVPSTSSHFCELLKNNKTLVEIDLMDPSGFEDEIFINHLLDTLKDHKSIKQFSFHVRNIRPSDQKETSLMKSLQKDAFISRLCISSSVISHKFTEALLRYASKEGKPLSHLEFYNCKVKKNDEAELKSLCDSGSVHQLAFYPEPRWDIMLKVINGPLNKINIPANAKWTQNGVTIAGGNGRGDATNQLYWPYGLFVDDDQTVVIADNENHRIIQWNNGDKTNGQVVAGGAGAGNGLNQLNYPTDVLIDKETDSLIICDQGNRRVVRWSRRSGTTQGEILINNIACWGLAMDEQRYLYVSDEGKYEVRRYQLGEKNGTLVAGGNGSGDELNQLKFPTYLFVDRQQNVYVSDSTSNRVMKWNKGAKEGIVVAGGQGQGNALTQVFYPYGLFVDTLGTLYVADSRNHRVIRWTQGATEGTVIAGGNGAGAGSNQFFYPFGLSFDRQGNLYVTDYGNDRIQRFSIE
ncbi:unnamed protein product [Rotaria magnacalcarata]